MCRSALTFGRYDFLQILPNIKWIKSHVNKIISVAVSSSIVKAIALACYGNCAKNDKLLLFGSLLKSSAAKIKRYIKIIYSNLNTCNH